MTKRSFLSDATDRFNTLGASFRNQIFGAILAVIGVILLWEVLRQQPGMAAPWLVVLTGWTASLVAGSLVVLGVVLLLGRRAGYWSAEALIGIEVLLLGLMTWSFVRDEGMVNWNARLDGESGGLVGWAIGNLLIAALGETFAAVIAGALIVAGAALLVRYTPLIFIAAGLLRALPGVGRLLNAAIAGISPGISRRHDEDDWTPMPNTPNFVSATAPEINQPPTPVKSGAPTRKTTKASAPVAPAPDTQKAVSKQPAIPKPQSPRAARAVAALPALDLLYADAGAYGNRDIAMYEQLIVNTLEDFNVPVRVVHVESGPTVTQFGVEPLYIESAGQKRKVRVNRIVNLADDLALALAAPAVRIEAPVPGRPYVGIEVPNPDKSLVSLRGILESSEMRKGGALALPLGRNTAGSPVVMDLTKAPHMLIAGATGSGKSVCINTIVTG
ncbi:MAG: DNA translocase FtsK, partial [Caldilinea sp.]